MALTNLNLLFAWLWILLGFVSGLGLGLFFHRENWLGGYGSFKRRLYRLAHISFFGLGAVNLLFWLTLQRCVLPESLARMATVATWAFIIGGVTMPLGCVIMAHCLKAHLFFAVPVVGLILGGALTLTILVRESTPVATAGVIINPKSEVQNPKSERNPNPEIRISGLARDSARTFSERRETHFGVRNSAFFRSSGTRDSDFELNPQLSTLNLP